MRWPRSYSKWSIHRLFGGIMRKFILLATTLCSGALILAGCGAPAGNTGPAANNGPAGNTANANKAAAANTGTASASDMAAAEAAVKKLMDDAATALSKNDADAMDKIYNDNYMLVNTDGSVQTKAERLTS